MKALPIILLCLVLNSCLSYDEATEARYQENRKLIENYIDEIGLTNNPFFEIIPDLEKDKQRKKHVASLSHKELKTLIDEKARNIPRLQKGTPRSIAYFQEIKGKANLEEAYSLLIEQYSDIIIEQ